jgi:putative transposase
VPRDRPSTFDPQLIAKYRRRLPGFDDKVISMYARGMTLREIQGHLAELYGIDVSPDLISAVTDAILDEIAEWQNRPLEAMYPLVFFDALRVKVRDEGTVRNKAVYIALGVRALSASLTSLRGIGPLAQRPQGDSRPVHRTDPSAVC